MLSQLNSINNLAESVLFTLKNKYGDNEEKRNVETITHSSQILTF